ncbi:MAG: hypothetical protein IPO67_16610 [Deltaproteobacteria bacterium]|nr:hypothetical protein [Deltaproteobacteria bacterium]
MGIAVRKLCRAWAAQAKRGDERQREQRVEHRTHRHLEEIARVHPALGEVRGGATTSARTPAHHDPE